jgi:TP901 family phage tail tape measure protein
MATNKETALIEIVLKGQQANASLKDMEKAARSLSAQLKNLPKDSQAFADKKAEFQKMSKSLKDLQNDVKGVGGVFQNIGKEIKGFGILAAGYLGFDWLTSSISGIIKNNAQLSDSLADIRKTTGMTEAEARKLNTAFGQINTRTAAKELRNIAIVGGQLGIAKGDIFGFTVAVDKMNVALGDEFTGGAEEVTKAMGGLRNIFTDIKTDKVDQDLLHIGNAINELASKGAATGPVVSDFANRIGGVGVTLGLTSGQVLGLSATLQELNVSTERGGTAVTRILQKMTTNTSEFAKVAGLPVKEFTELVNKDLYGAFVKVVEGSKKGNVSATEFGETLDSLGVDGAGASEVFAKLGNNTGLLNEKVGLANTSLKGTSSIMNEFNMKNQTLGADLEKIGKGFSSWFSNSTFSDGLKSITSGLADLFDKTPEAEKLTDAWRNQKSVVAELESTMVPLLHRHDELKAKATLNKEEQTELDTIIAKVAETIPFAVTEFDKYGKAMDINTSKGRDFLRMEEQKLELMNKDALTARRLELIAYSKEVAHLQSVLQNRDAEGDLFKTIKVKQDGIGERSTYIFKDVKLTNEEIIQLNKNLQDTKDKQLGAFAIINELTGKMVDTGKAAKEEIKGTGDAITNEQAEAAKKAADEWAKFLQKIKDLEHEQEIGKLSGIAKELEVTKDKYDKLRAEAKNNKDAIKRINALELEENYQLAIKYANKESEQAAKELDEQLKHYRKKEEEKKKIESYSSSSKDLSHSEKAKKETDDLTQEWDNRLEAATNYNLSLKAGEENLAIDIVALTAAKNAQIEALNQKHLETTTEQNSKALQKQISSFEKSYNSSVQVMDALMRAKHQINEKEINDNEYKADNEIKIQKKLLDNKAITQKEYDKRIQKIEDDKEAKNLKLKQKQAKQDKEYAMFKILINTAIAVSQALAAYDYVSAVAFAALGAIELGIAASAPLPQYAEGGYSSDEPKGFTTGATRYTNSASGRDFIAGEAGKEWIASNWMVNDPVYGPQIEMLEAVQRSGARSSSASQSSSNSSVSNGSDNKSNDVSALTAVVFQLSKTLNALQTDGIQAYQSYDLNLKQQNSVDAAKRSAQVAFKS